MTQEEIDTISFLSYTLERYRQMDERTDRQTERNEAYLKHITKIDKKRNSVIRVKVSDLN